MSGSRFFVLLVFLMIFAGAVFAQTEITVGDTVTGEANPAAVEYALFLEEGQTVGIRLSSPDFDTFLKLFAEDGSLIAENDDSDTGERPTDSYLLYSASESGTVIIRVSVFGAAGPTGTYSLSIEALELIDELDAGSLAYGDSTTISPNGAAVISFGFEGTAGDVVNIFANSATNEDTHIALLDADGNTLLSNDDTAFSTNSAIRRFALPGTGAYRVLVTAFGDARLFGDVELKLEQTALLLLNNGAQTISLSPNSTSDVVVLDVEAESSYIITVNLSETIDSTLWINAHEAAAGFAGSRLRVSGTNFISFAFTAQTTGRASIEFELATFDETVDLTIAAQVR